MNDASHCWFALARASSAVAEGRVDVALALLREAGLVPRDAKLHGLPPVRMLELATASLRELTGGGILHFADDGTCFQLDDRKADLSRRQPLRRILTALVQAKGPLSTASLVAAGWPGECVVGGAGNNRVRVAIAALRRAGLAGVLHRASSGYFFGCELEIRIVPRCTLIL